MAYTSVPTYTTGDVFTAANANTYWRDNFAAGVPDIFTAAGDLAYATAANAAAPLAIGAAGALLRSTGSAPAWLAAGAEGSLLGILAAAPAWVNSWLVTAALGSDHTVSGQVITLTAGANVAFGDFCYMKADGKMGLVDADAIATMSGVFMAAETIAADAAGLFLMPGGVARDDTWAWTVGGLIFATVTGTTGNTLSQTAPTGVDDVIQIVGVAMHADRMLFLPQLVQIEHTG